MKEDIVKRYSSNKGLAIANLVLELEERIIALEEAMVFIVEKYTQEENKTKILIPDYLKNG